MSKVERAASIIIGIVGLILMGIQAWDVLDKHKAMNSALAIITWGISVGMVVYAVYKNLKAARRSNSLIGMLAEKERSEKTCQEELGKSRARISELENAPPRVDYEQLMALTERDRHENVIIKTQLTNCENRVEVLEAQLRECKEDLLEERQEVIATTQPHSAPTIGITLRETVIEPYDHTPGRNYPRKLRLYLSNDGDDIHLGVGQWIPGQVVTQLDKPPVCIYETKNNLGKFDAESSDKFIAAGKWFRLYVGIDEGIN